ncbi:MAG: DNA-processing protein DprA [Candidatus Paceibacterota bacterium]
MEEAAFYNAINIVLDGQYKKIARLKEKYGSFEKAYFSGEGEIEKAEVEKEWEKLKAAGIKLILAEAEEYPKALKEIPWPPMGIYFKGKLPEKNERIIAMVGTRKATFEGKRFAKETAEKLAKIGIGIISGLAFGIDTESHEGTLRSGGKTYAVLANGLSSIYPKQNENLAKKILEAGGGLISEYPMDATPYKDRFIERNRIVSGIAEGVLIIEAPERSGSLATARFAIEQNKDVYVAPGPFYHANYKGSAKLLREGARIVTTAEDLLEDLGITEEEEKEEAAEKNIFSEKQRTIFEALKMEARPCSIDKIIQISKINPQELNQELAEMTLIGIIKEEGGLYRL